MLVRFGVGIQFANASMAREQSAHPPRSTSAVSETSLRHLRIGWLTIALFGLLGLVLETFHGFKVGAYLDRANETRRLMWTLAHAHGTLIGVLHLAMAFTLQSVGLDGPRVQRASTALLAAGALLPAGFFLGGVRFYAGDPGLGIALVPIGAVLLIYAAAQVGWSLHHGR